VQKKDEPMKIWVPILLCLTCSFGFAQTKTVYDGPDYNGSGRLTVTKTDNSATAAAVGNGVAVGTGAGLTYFLIIRPRLQEMHNNKINRIEGQFTPVYGLLDELVASPIPVRAQQAASDIPTVEGHRLGESWNDFVARAPYLQKRIAQCASEKRPASGKHMKKYVFNPCADLWMMADKPDSDLTLDCLRLGLGASKDMVCQDFSGEVSFHDNKLVSLKLILEGMDWKGAFPALVEKFGQPDGRDQAATLGVWSTAEYHLVAAQVNNDVALAWMTPERYRTTVAAVRSAREVGADSF
jgi:hypothetical protein